MEKQDQHSHPSTLNSLKSERQNEERVADSSSEEEIATMGEMEISEKALRPLISEKDEKIHDEEVQQIVK